MAAVCFLTAEFKTLTVTLQDTGDGYNRNFKLFFGTPSQKNDDIPENSFNVDTRFSPLIVASSGCKNDYCFPIYNPTDSSTDKINPKIIEFKPF